jgi:arachidonate 15-lipoxygenase
MSYDYDYTLVPPLAMARAVPPEAQPSRDWYAKVVKVVLQIAKNRLSLPDPSAVASSGGLIAAGADPGGGSEVLPLAQLDLPPIDLARSDLDSLDLDKANAGAGGLMPQGALDLAGRVLQIAAAVAIKGITDPFGVFDTILQQARGPSGRPRDVDDYRRLFRTLPLPSIAVASESDAVFASLRVAGYNPLVLQGVADPGAAFPVTDAHLAAAGLAGDTLAAAGGEGRLYLTDYRKLAEVVHGSFPAGPKYSFAPKALFVRPTGSGRLVPVAIQCGQDPLRYPVFGPGDGEAWTRAKILVNCADANHHELVSHLSHTHLLVEPFAIATPRRLPEAHPIRRLLSPHFEGTLAINDAAQRTLIRPGKQVDAALAGTIEASRAVAAKALMELDFDAMSVPRSLEARRVMAKELEYPYRDDALDVWKAISRWVEANVDASYADDAAIAADASLLAWGRELAAPDGGRLSTFGEGQPGAIRTRAWLTEALTTVIFTASAQHAAVNFAQGALMTFAPAVPGAAYRAAPLSEADTALWPRLDLYPPLDVAQVQMEFLTLLGSVHHTTLGQYPKDHFAETSLLPALQDFQAELASIGARIEVANQTRTRYPFLNPADIPQSINI